MRRVDCSRVLLVGLLCAILAPPALSQGGRLSQVWSRYFEADGQVWLSQIESLEYDDSDRFVALRFKSDRDADDARPYLYEYDTDGRIVRFRSSGAKGERIETTWDHEHAEGVVQAKGVGSAGRPVQFPTYFGQTAFVGPRALERIEQINGRSILQVFSWINVDGQRLRVLVRHFSASYEPNPVPVGAATHYMLWFNDMKAKVEFFGDSQLRVDYMTFGSDTHLGSALIDVVPGGTNVQRIRLYDDAGRILCDAAYEWAPRDSNLEFEWFFTSLRAHPQNQPDSR